MISPGDSVIQHQRAAIEAGVSEGVERVCDILHVAKEELESMIYRLKGDYKFYANFTTVQIQKSGKAFALSIVDCIVDDPPIDFARVLATVLEPGETVLNPQIVKEEIQKRTLDIVNTVINGRS